MPRPWPNIDCMHALHAKLSRQDATTIWKLDHSLVWCRHYILMFRPSRMVNNIFSCAYAEAFQHMESERHKYHASHLCLFPFFLAPMEARSGHASSCRS